MFVKSAKNVAAYGDNIDKMSQKMGLSAEKYQEWDFIMQHSGTSMESLKAGMKTLATAAENNNEAFSRLGITQEQMASMSQEELFGATLAGLQNVENETERTYLAGQLLGRGATELGALLNTSAEDTEAMRKQVHELGGVMSNDAVKAAARFQDSLQNLNVSIDGLKRKATQDFLPGMATIMDGLSLIFSGQGGGAEMVAEGISQIVTTMNEKLPEIIDGITTITVDLLPVIAESAVTLLTGLVDSFSKNEEKIVSSAVTIVKTLVGGITDNLPQIIKIGTELIVELLNAIAADPQEVINTAIDIISTLVGGFWDALPQIITAAGELIAEFISALLDDPQAILDKGIEIVDKVIDGIEDSWEAIKKAGGKIVDKIKEGISGAWEGLKTWFNGIWNNLFGNRNVNVNVNKSETYGPPPPGRAGGLDFVPYDGFAATLHRGERILTKEENTAYNENRSSDGYSIYIYQNFYGNEMSAAELEQEAATQARREIAIHRV